jgi:tetratricopeptide (TPR) repeat protein
MQVLFSSNSHNQCQSSVDRILLVVIAFSILMVLESVWSQIPTIDNKQSNRFSVAVLAFENRTGDPMAVHWGYAIRSSIFEHLKMLRDVHLISSAGYALSQLNITNENLTDTVQFRRLGKLIGADWIVSGNYQYKNKQWIISIRVFNVETNIASVDSTFISQNWVDIQDHVSEQILKDIGFKPSEVELQKMKQCWTTSPEAFENYGRAAAEDTLAKQEKYLRRSIETDSHFAIGNATLAAVLALQGKLMEAEQIGARAVGLAPDDGFVYKEHGLVLYLRNKLDEAETNLQMAAQFDSDDAETFRRLGDLHYTKNEESQAINDYSRALQIDSFAPFATDIRERLNFLKPRQTPAYIHYVQPVEYTIPTLNDTLHRKLTAQEMSLIINPLDSTPEMRHWAYELTVGATNDLQKAKMLFDALAHHVDELQIRSRSAKEVFNDWNIPGANFHCEEYAFLYVALARSLGLKAYVVDVQEACDGRKSGHSCAGVIFGQKVLLVDPAFRWFGAPHRQFAVLDDLQTMAVYLCELQDAKRCQIAFKLAPNLAWVQMNWFISLVSENRLQEAQEVLKLIVQLDPDSWIADSCKAQLALRQGHPDLAIEFLKKAVKSSPSTGVNHLLLGYAYMQQKKLDEAEEAYHNALHCILPDEYIKQAYEGISAVAAAYYSGGHNKQAQGDLSGALIDYSKAIELKPDFAEAHCVRGVVEQTKGDLKGALADYNKAIELKPDLVEAYNNRGYAKQIKGDLDGAEADYDKVIELNPKLNPGIVIGYRMLGYLHYDRQEFTNALNNFRKVCQLDSSDDYARFRIFLIRSLFGETQSATNELQTYLNSRDGRKINDWQSKIGRFLAGQISESELFEAAQSINQQTYVKQHCEAYFYTGTKQLIKGNKIIAAEYFKKCIETGAKDLSEYQSAASELKFLKTD